MSRLIAVLLSSCVFGAAFPIQAAAQVPATIIAHDYCQSDYNTSGTGEIRCIVVLGGLAVIDDGIDPALSADGSRIAFVRHSQPGLFVLNLSDWSLTSLHSSGLSPAWSPDGLKLAFAAGELHVMSADGSNIVQRTNNVGFLGEPAWSRDGGTIAFDCEVESGNRDICAIDADGANFRRLTFDAAWDSGAVFSPDGFTIAFATTRYSWLQIALMNLDGTGVSPVGAGIFGFQPAWSPDGNQIAFVVPFVGSCEADGRICNDSVAIMNRDGTGLAAIWPGNRPVLALAVRPVAFFYFQPGCNGLDCALDGSYSWGGSGGIMSYTWNFGDGMSGSGPTVTHTYATDGTYRVTLTVTDSAGISSTQSRDLVVAVNLPPTASFTHACVGAVCAFNGSGSSDPDGSITIYSWSFGDGTTGSGVTPSHTYAASGTYAVSLTVMDNSFASGVHTGSVTVSLPVTPMHVGDLDRTRTNQQNTWTAFVTIAVHNGNHGPVANAMVSGSWSIGGTGSCTTDGAGQCVIAKSTIPKKTRSLTFTMVNVTKSNSLCGSVDNHDPDGDSNGTSVTVQ